MPVFTPMHNACKLVFDSECAHGARINASQTAQLEVKLDGFHGLRRVTKLVPKAHGGAVAYTGRLRDAMFRVYKEDLDVAVETLRRLGNSEEEIKKRMRTDWGYFLSKCRRFGGVGA